MITSILGFLFVDNLNAAVTLIVGLFAFGVYSWQKSDEKIKAARVLLSEIRNAELEIETIKGYIQKPSTKSDFPSVMPVNSWEKFSYLFASDFDQDEMNDLNRFYNLCGRIEEAVRRDNGYLWLATESRANIVQDKLVDLIDRSIKKKNRNYEVDNEMLNTFKEKVLDVFSNDPYWYTPGKTINDLSEFVPKLPKITTSTAGMKLKQIARLKH